MMRRLRHRLRSLSDDRGITLVELLVGMGIMTIALTVFTATIYSLNSSAAAIDNTRVSSNQVNVAFLQLDKTVRYASSISTPSTAANTANNWYVELQTTNTGVTVCKQLQLNTTTKTLRFRTWKVTDAGAPYALDSTWTVMAANVTAPTTGVPFQLNTTGDYGTVREQLVVNLASTSGNPAAKTSRLQGTFVAVNSTAASAAVKDGSLLTSNVCKEVTRP